jgi:hypothetical protein
MRCSPLSPPTHTSCRLAALEESLAKKRPGSGGGRGAAGFGGVAGEGGTQLPNLHDRPCSTLAGPAAAALAAAGGVRVGGAPHPGTAHQGLAPLNGAPSPPHPLGCPARDLLPPLSTWATQSPTMPSASPCAVPLRPQTPVSITSAHGEQCWNKPRSTKLPTPALAPPVPHSPPIALPSLRAVGCPARDLLPHLAHLGGAPRPPRPRACPPRAPTHRQAYEARNVFFYCFIKQSSLPLQKG